MTYLERLLPMKSHDALITWSCNITGQIKTPIKSPLPGAYGHQTWQIADLPWAAPNHKVSRPFGHVVLQDQLTI